MHKIAATILLLAFIGQTFNQGFYYLDYMVDKAEYVKNCVNKYRPMMHCNGKCQLMKKIQEQEKKEQQQAPEMKLASKFEVVSSKSSFLLDVQSLSIDNTINYLLVNSGSPVDQPSSFFHPPGA